jgi:hypothetical protein
MNYSTTTALVLGLAALAASVGCVRGPVAPDKACVFPEREITVDGDVADWSGATWYDVSNAGSQWLGQGITAEGWSGPSDLSYRWAGSWDGKGKLYFIFDVTDDCVISPPAQPNSFLNDCVELMIDYNHSGGPRFTEVTGEKVLRGYEMHFLPTQPPLVFVDDRLSPMYPMAKPQNDLFRNQYAGEIAVRRNARGYVMEIGFKLPGTAVGDGTMLGIDTDVCDDDGKGRESLLIWHSGQVNFWLTMDHYGTVVLRKDSTRKSEGTK